MNEGVDLGVIFDESFLEFARRVDAGLISLSNRYE
jgi:hypothetical protein